MTYFNPIYQYGLEKFCHDCVASGIDGLIIPELPPEEGDEIGKYAGKSGVDLIYLLAPTSVDARIKLVAGKIARVYLSGFHCRRHRRPA